MNRKEALIQMAQQRGVDLAIAKIALEDADREAVITLLNKVDFAQDANFVIPKYIDEVYGTARKRNKLLEVADILLERRSHVLYSLAYGLAEYTDAKAVSLLRKMMTLDWAYDASRDAAASALISAAHFGDAERALHDSCDLVRVIAVKQLEQNHNASALILALENDSIGVRRIAAFYMGRNKVYEALDALLKMVSGEEDVEALRGAIWSLGVLRVKDIRHQLEPFLQHDNELIRQTTQEALDKLT